MKVLFDTSALVPVFIAEHPYHDSSWHWLNQVHSCEIEGSISAHSLAELYSVLTRYPGQARISPQLAQRMMPVNLESVMVLPLTVDDYERAIIIHLVFVVYANY